MLPKRQLAHLIEARVIAKQRKINIKNSITSVTFEDKAIESSWIPKNELSARKNLDWKEDSAFDDDVVMIDDDKNIINVNAFDILMKAAFKNFESSKILDLRSLELSDWQKRRIADEKHKLATSANGCQLFTAGFLIIKS